MMGLGCNSRRAWITSQSGWSNVLHVEGGDDNEILHFNPSGRQVGLDVSKQVF